MAGVRVCTLFKFNSIVKSSPLTVKLIYTIHLKSNCSANFSAPLPSIAITKSLNSKFFQSGKKKRNHSSTVHFFVYSRSWTLSMYLLNNICFFSCELPIRVLIVHSRQVIFFSLICKESFLLFLTYKFGFFFK